MHESLSNAVAKISADKDYHRLFAHAFGSPEITSDKIARALEQFLLVQVSYNSKFDRVMNGAAKFHGRGAARLCVVQHGIRSVSRAVRRGLFSLPRRAAVSEPGLREQRTWIPHSDRPRAVSNVTDNGRRSRQIRRAVSAQRRPHRAVHARRTIPHLGGGRGALCDRREAQRDARSRISPSIPTAACR